MEGEQFADALFWRIEFKLSVRVFPHVGNGKIFCKALRDANGPGAGTTAAVRRGECLMQVHVHDVEAHVPRTRAPHDRIQVGTIVVKQPTGGVNLPCDFLDVLFE